MTTAVEMPRLTAADRGAIAACLGDVKAIVRAEGANRGAGAGERAVDCAGGAARCVSVRALSGAGGRVREPWRRLSAGAGR